jgi:hypothetical protein
MEKLLQKRQKAIKKKTPLIDMTISIARSATNTYQERI